MEQKRTTRFRSLYMVLLGIMCAILAFPASTWAADTYKYDTVKEAKQTATAVSATTTEIFDGYNVAGGHEDMYRWRYRVVNGKRSYLVVEKGDQKRVDKSITYGAFKQLSKTVKGYTTTTTEERPMYINVKGKKVKVGIHRRVGTETRTPVRYTVKFNGNGATSGTMKNARGTVLTKTSYTNAFKRKGYDFCGWAFSKNTKPADVKLGKTGMVKFNNIIKKSGYKKKTVTVYAIWQKKDSQGSLIIEGPDGTYGVYRDSACKDLVATTKGAARLNAGTYYVRPKSFENEAHALPGERTVKAVVKAGGTTKADFSFIDFVENYDLCEAIQTNDSTHIEPPHTYEVTDTHRVERYEKQDFGWVYKKGKGGSRIYLVEQLGGSRENTFHPSDRHLKFVETDRASSISPKEFITTKAKSYRYKIFYSYNGEDILVGGCSCCVVEITTVKKGTIEFEQGPVPRGVYGIYSDQACKRRVAKVTLDTRASEKRELPIGKYYVRLDELIKGTPVIKNDTVIPVTVKDGDCSRVRCNYMLCDQYTVPDKEESTGKSYIDADGNSQGTFDSYLWYMAGDGRALVEALGGSKYEESGSLHHAIERRDQKTTESTYEKNGRMVTETITTYDLYYEYNGLSVKVGEATYTWTKSHKL